MDSPAKTLARVVGASKDILRDHAIGAVLGLLFLWFLPGWLRCCFVFVVSVLFLSSVFGTYVTDWKPRGKISAAGKSVIITGCDSGFGHMLAARLDDLGFQVFAGCLFPDGEGAKNLKKSTSDRLHVIGLDVTKDEDVQKSLEYVTENLGSNKLWAAVCNAGLNDGGEVLWTDMSIISKVIDINLFGVIRVTKAFLPLICKSKGRVAAVASAAGRHTFPGMTSYCVSKYGVVSFCESLRLEMYKFGVQVVTVEPWMYRTPITNEDTVRSYIKKTWEKAPEDIKSLFPEDYIEAYTKNTHEFLNYSVSLKPSEVVSCLEEAVTATYPKTSYSPGTVCARVLFWLFRKLPRPVYDLMILSPTLKRQL